VLAAGNPKFKAQNPKQLQSTEFKGSKQASWDFLPLPGMTHGKPFVNTSGRPAVAGPPILVGLLWVL
jgi:hypothetical protein